MTIALERIKTAGAADALMRHICTLRQRAAETISRAVVNGDRFNDAEKKIEATEAVLAEMRETLRALQEIAPENT